MYYLSIYRNGQDLLIRQAFADYSEAVRECAKYCEPKARGSTMLFYTEARNGQFVRSSAEIEIPERIDCTNPDERMRYERAAKYSIAFNYDSSFHFVIESQAGIDEVDCSLRDEDED